MTIGESLFHIAHRDAWQFARRAGSYQPDSLRTEGFIHLSTRAQVAATGHRFYSGVDGLVLLQVDPARLRWELRWEEADGQSFPHLYGPLDLDAVISVQAFST